MSHHHTHGDTGNIQVAFFLNLGFTIAEIIGGLAINSVAVLSDAVHDLGDSVSLGLAWFLSGYAQKDDDPRYSYGYRRFSLLGALLNALLLVGGSLFVLSEAIPRLTDPQDFSARGMIAFAVAGVAINGLAVLRLRRSTSMNAQVVGWHLLEDVLGWAAVLLVGIVSLFVDLPILDPLLSILITSYVLYNVIGTLRDVGALFLQAVPKDASVKAIQDRLEALDEVRSTHHIHLWSLDGEHHVLTAHLVLDENISRDEAMCVKRASKDAVQNLDLHITHITFELEYADEDCSMASGDMAAR